MKFENEHDRGFLRAAAQSLQDENSRLRTERALFLAQSKAAKEEKAELEAQIHNLQEVAKSLKEELEGLEQEIRILKEQLDRRNKTLYGRKSERRDTGTSAEPPPEDSDKAPDPKKKRKPQRGHGPTPQPKLPVVEVKNELAGDALSCEHCGGTLKPLGHEAEEAELIALRDRKIELERHLRMKYRCSCCQIGVTVAPGPVKLIPGGRYALSFTVEVAYQKYLANVPLDRQVQMFRHDGLQVTTAALFDQVDALATALTPTYQAIWAALQTEPVLHADETPWAVLSNGHTQNERFYAWVVVGSQYVGFQLLDTRSQEGAATVLGDFSGTLVVDGLTSYPAAANAVKGEKPRFKIANCHAHSRRKFCECEAHYPVESKAALDLYHDLYEIERRGKEPGANLTELRDTQSRPLINQLFRWAKEQSARPDLLPSSGLVKAVNYLLNHETALRVFLDDPAVAITNNAAERALRTLVLVRKISYGSRSRRGTYTAAVLHTLTESAKRVGINPKSYLEAAAEHALRKAGAVLLPDEFKRQMEAAATTQEE